MALTDRSLVRDEIYGAIAAVTAIQNAYNYPPLALEGASPVVWIHNDGTHANFLARNSNQIDHYFVITIAVNRKAHDVSNAEIVLDDVYTSIMQALRDIVVGTNYSALQVRADRRSQAIFGIVDGIPYRFEEIYIMARSNITG